MKTWPMTKLEDVCDIRIGRTPRRDTPKYWGGSHPWVTISDLNKDIITETAEGVSDIAVRDVMPEPVPKGTLLFSFKLSIGKTAFAGVPLHTNEAIAALVVKDQQKLDKAYLRYALNAHSHEGGASNAVLGKLLNKEKIKLLEIPLPPLSTQKEIVSLLDQASDIKKLRAEASRKMENFAPALFYKMFGDPGKNEKGWEVRQLRDVTTRITKGTTPTTLGFSYQEGGINFIKIESLTEDGRVLPNKVAHVSEECHSAFERSQLKLNDVLFSIAGALGRVAIVKSDILPANTNQALSIISLKADVLPEFVYYFLKSSYVLDQIKVLKVGVAQLNLSLKQIGDLKIPVPPIELQKQFVDRVIDAEIFRNKQVDSKRKLAEVFDGLLNVL